MLFLTPAAAVPALVALGSLLGELPEILRHRAHPERLRSSIADGWYAVGPALVIAALADGAAHDATWGVLLLALAAQISIDLVATHAARRARRRDRARRAAAGARRSST